MAEQKQKIQPIKGINVDDDETKISPEQARFLKGVEVLINKSGSDSPQGGNAGVITEQQSNVITIPDPTAILPQNGYNFCIGSFYYPVIDWFMWYVYNSSGDHCIILYSAITNNYVSAMQRTDLNFQVDKRIRTSDIVLVNNTTQTKTLLYFIDAFNEPRKFNLNTALSTAGYTIPFYNTFLPHSEAEEFIKAIKYPPYLRPQIKSTGKDGAVKYNYIVNKMFQWRYRYVYDDGEKSVLSPISTLGYIAQDNCAVSSGVTTSDNYFELEMYAGSAIVVRIEIFFRYNNGDAINLESPTDWYLYDTLEKYDGNNTVALENHDLNINIPNSFTYKFYNDREYQLFDISESNRIYDTLPEVAGAQELTDNNAIVYADCKEGKDNLSEIYIGTADAPSITIGADFPSNDVIETMTIRGYLVIHSHENDHNEPIWAKQGSGLTPSGNYVFGGLSTIYPSVANPALESNFAQSTLEITRDDTFGNEKVQGGFLVYLAGTPYKTITRQRQYAGAFVSYDVYYAGLNPTDRQFIIDQVQVYNRTYVQYFEIKDVPIGKYVLRVGSHIQSELDSRGEQNTSTYLLGAAQYAAYLVNPNTITRIFNDQREIIINGCDGVVNGIYDVNDCISGLPSGGNPALKGFPVIWDISYIDDGVAEQRGINFCGYFYEEALPVGRPIELAQVVVNDTSPNPYDVVSPATTDHNGFFFVSVIDITPFAPIGFQNVIIEFYLVDNTTTQILANNTQTWLAGDGRFGTFQTNQIIDSTKSINGGGLPGISCYSICNHYRVTGTLINTVNGQGAGGVPVILSRGGYAITDAQGVFEIVAHADSSVGNGDRDDYLIISQSMCVILDENDSQCVEYRDKAGATVVFPAVNYSEVAPVNADCSAPTTFDVTYSKRDVTVLFSDQKGLKGGGFYMTGFILYDYALRPSFVQAPRWMELYIQSIPERFGGNNLVPPDVFATITSNFFLPDWVKYMAFARTKNLFTANYLQWMVNSVSFIDINGDVTSVANATSIKLNISNLNDFNEIYGFSTNTVYQYSDGDRILFIRNGDGSFYDGASAELIDLEANGTTDDTTVEIVIPNDPRLSTLVAGARVEFYTPRKREGAELFFEISNLYPCRKDSISQSGLNVPCVITYDDLVNKNAVINSLNSINAGVVNLNTWDTYWHTRSISVNGVVVTSFVPYEHHSYNDFWDSRAEDIGRINIINKDARSVQRTNLIRWSRIFDTDTFTNGLCSFIEGNARPVFKQYGAIRLLYSVRNTLFVFQELGTFKCSINKDSLRTGDGGSIIADSSNFISTPDAISGEYGLQDPATFQNFDGLFVWLDTIHSALVFCDGSQAVDASIALKIKSYILDKCRYMYKYNLQSPAFPMFAHSGKNPKTGDYLLSFFTMTDFSTAGDTADFINNEREIVIQKNETIIINPNLKICKGFANFTPEYYGIINNGRDGNHFITFYRGKAYIHNYDTAVTSVNTFYGVKTDTIVDVVCNAEEDLVKVFSHIAIESNDIPFFADKVTSSKKDQLSKIPIELMIRKEGIYYAEFKQDINSDGGLIDGDAIRGVYARVRLVRSQDVLYQDKYSELNNIVIYFQKSMLSNK